VFNQVQQKFKKFGALGLLVWAVAMIQVGEYALAGGLLILASVAFCFQIHDWKGIRKRPALTKTIRLMSLVGIALALVFCGVVLFKVKASKPWSNVLIKNDHREEKINTPDTPVNSFEVYSSFRSAYRTYKVQLGNPKLKEQSAGAAPELHEQERATVFWSQVAGYYILSRDTPKWEHREDRPWPTGDWWSKRFVTKKMPNLECAKPPFGGLAARWYKDSKEWEWVGCTDWNCFCGPDNIFIQEFDGGTLIGPLRRSYDNDNVGDVVVLVRDGTYHRVNFEGEIPACRNPEKP